MAEVSSTGLPGAPPPDPLGRRWRTAALTVLIVVLAGVTVLAVQLRKPDTGIAACQRVAAHLTATGDDTWLVGLQSDFAHSGYTDVRNAGQGLFSYSGRIVTPAAFRVALNQVSDACQSHGVRVPRG